MAATQGATRRLFYAIWPDPPARKALARLAGEVARDVQGRAPPDANLHLTLAFLGAVPASRLDPLIALGDRVATAATPFPLALDRIGGTSYRVAWLAPAEYCEPLHALQGRLIDALAMDGYPRERRMFRPHITLARDGVRSARRGAIPPITWPVERLTLVASTPRRGGSDYREVAGWMLGS